jgi:cytochrome c553
MVRLFVVVILLFASLLAFAQQSTQTPATAYTAVQAEAGEREFQSNKFGVCADCHGTGLKGRRGEAGELPPLTSLSEDYQKLIAGNGGRVPQLIGPQFAARWRQRSTRALVEEFNGRFSPPLSEETRLNMIAYLLKANGALPGSQPLTSSTDIEIRTLLGNSSE